MKEIIKCRDFSTRRKKIYLKELFWEIAILLIALLWPISNGRFGQKFLLCLLIFIFSPLNVRLRIVDWTIPTEVEIDDDMILIRAECLWWDRPCTIERHEKVYIGDRGDKIHIEKQSPRQHTYIFDSSKCWPEDAVAELREALLRHGWTLEMKYI